MTRAQPGFIDVHAHFSPPTTVQTRQAVFEASRANNFLVPEPYEWRLDATLDFMNETGTAMQLLSNVPTRHEALRASNDYGRDIVARHPARFGLLAALPTDDAHTAVDEASRVGDADGWAVRTVYNGHSLAESDLDPLWDRLNHQHAVVFVHPNAYAPSTAGLPTPLVEVAFDTGRTITGMLYAGVFNRYPHITFLVAHAGGAIPLLAGRLSLLGTEAWVPNPHGLTAADIRIALARLWVDTAASASDQQLAAAVATFGDDHVVYGSDWGVACTTATSARRNIHALNTTHAISPATRAAIPTRAAHLFPRAIHRAQQR
ncbi:amidohydrolase family protein [Amycolatopsis pithecellobii]|uniref:6-methylsalicylate decarboxylase n=1 Tax=Amycolatopsis pithecellobii TaxID=664692 RepID=A0A6N7Z275_9PSEU|nr:amidohydrolase family protein [Amycolatopsis pithecellobii]MTD53834.1 amidohydrolase family protein [Amycolatopsis pithecellobii]